MTRVNYYMRNSIARSRVSLFILLCFLIGQYIVFSHHHSSDLKTTFYFSKHTQPSQIVSEKCNLCDMMHHMDMAIMKDAVPLLLPVVANTHYIRQHDYIGIALILSAGRSPPAF